MTTHLRLAISCLIVLFIACLAWAGLETDGKTVTVTEKDAGTKVKLAKGDTLVVRLEVQSGTAFGWKIAKYDDKILKAPAKPDIERPEKPRPGGKVTHVFRFTVEAVGSSELEMHYVRPFDKDKAPAKVFKLSAEVE